MNDRTRVSRSRLAALAVAGLLVLAPTAVVAQGASGSPAPAEDVNPYFETGAVPDSGKGFKVGYISLGDSIPFVKLVTDDIAAQAAIAGLELSPCDSQIKAEVALECAQTFATQGVQAVINFNLHSESSKEICAAYGNVPTISIDIHQDPCETAFYGANNYKAGLVAGEGVGNALKAENGCKYDKIVTMESPTAGVVNTDRIGGMLDGLASVCGPIDEANVNHQDGKNTVEGGLATMNDVLPTLAPGSITVLLSLNDDMALGSLAAMKTVGRDGELRIGAQGADPSAHYEIACNPVWLADAAYFPEKYGRTTIPAVIDVLNGKTVPKLLFTPHIAITKDNIREVYPETKACA